jgi:hypothetical protein
MMRALLAGLLLASSAVAADPLIIHEWGTFTSLQDEKGNALGRINTDDEPIPRFVHTMPSTHLFNPTNAYTGPLSAKGMPCGDPQVTMRLETPVVYFHRPKDFIAPASLDLRVTFKGGWLSQYFPDAVANVEGTKTPEGAPPWYVTRPPLSGNSVSTLEWKNIKLASAAGELPQTTDKVWLAPRAVKADDVTVGNEREKFLFYRGVGNLDSPVKVTSDGDTIRVVANAPEARTKFWVVNILADGRVWFNRSQTTIDGGRVQVPEVFKSDPPQYDTAHLAKLRESMKKELTAEGLYDDEAEAMLNTWERSYFQNPGTRVFFVVPQSWTDAVIPLTINTEAKITRVMVGRVEVVTKKQRDLLAKMATATLAPGELKSAIAAMESLQKDPAKQEAYNALAGGGGNLADLGVEAPEVYKQFLALGRFRTALILDSKAPALQKLAWEFVPADAGRLLFPKLVAPTVPAAAPIGPQAPPVQK